MSITLNFRSSLLRRIPCLMLPTSMIFNQHNDICNGLPKVKVIKGALIVYIFSIWSLTVKHKLKWMNFTYKIELTVILYLWIRRRVNTVDFFWEEEMGSKTRSNRTKCLQRLVLKMGATTNILPIEIREAVRSIPIWSKARWLRMRAF